LSPRELPLWVRAIGAVMLMVGSWWVVHTEGLTNIVGHSIGILAVGVLAASVIRGLGAPIGLWPEGDFRERFVPWFVVGVAVAFSLAMVFSRIGLAPGAMRLMDLGVWVIVISGVLAWGFVVAFVPLRSYSMWFGIAVVLALAPYAIGAAASGIGSEACLVAIGEDGTPGSCELSVFRGMLFFVPASIAGGLVTYELGFRRLLIGDPETAGVVLVIVAAIVATAWAWMVGEDISWLGSSAWILGATALGAGCLYVLSGALLVSSVYTGIAVGTHLAFGLAARVDLAADPSMLGMRGGLAWLHLGVGAALLVVVGRRRKVLGGIR